MALGTRGAGELYLLADLMVAIIVFGLLYVGMNNYLMNNARNFASGDTVDIDALMADRVTPPWYILPVGFIIACILRAVYGGGWMEDIKSLSSWVLIECSVFVLSIIYIALDNYVLNVLPDMINGIFPTVDDYLSDMIFPLWNNLLWLVVLGLVFYGIIKISRTPGGEYTSEVYI